MSDSGWIKLYRKIQKSDMYKSLTSEQRDVMIQCLLFANRFECEWEWKKEIFKCKPGQFITSLLSLKKVCAKDVSLQNIRTALLKLEKWCFLTNVSTKTGRLITICKWSIYQSDLDETNKGTNKAPTKHQQSTNKALTSNKSNKKDKKDKNDKKKDIGEFTINKNSQIITDYLSDKSEHFVIAFNEFWEMRKRINKPIETKRTFNKIINNLNKHSNDREEIMIELLNQSSDHRWQGIFPIKEDNSNLDEKKSKLNQELEKWEKFCKSQGAPQ